MEQAESFQWTWDWNSLDRYTDVFLARLYGCSHGDDDNDDDTCLFCVVVTVSMYPFVGTLMPAATAGLLTLLYVI